MGMAVNTISCMRFANVCYWNAGRQLTLFPIWRPLPTSPLYDRAEHDHPMFLVALHDIPVHFWHGELLSWRKSIVRLLVTSVVNKRLTLGAWSIPDRCTHTPSGGNIKKYMSHVCRMNMESHGGIILTGEKRRIRRKSYPSATLSITNPTWTDPGVNPDLHGERPATNRRAMARPCLLRLDTQLTITRGHACAGRIRLQGTRTVYLCPSVSAEELRLWEGSLRRLGSLVLWGQ
jgi:hypothetical protein